MLGSHRPFSVFTSAVFAAICGCSGDPICEPTTEAELASVGPDCLQVRVIGTELTSLEGLQFEGPGTLLVTDNPFLVDVSAIERFEGILTLSRNDSLQEANLGEVSGRVEINSHANLDTISLQTGPPPGSAEVGAASTGNALAIVGNSPLANVTTVCDSECSLSEFSFWGMEAATESSIVGEVDEAEARPLPDPPDFDDVLVAISPETTLELFSIGHVETIETLDAFAEIPLPARVYLLDLPGVSQEAAASFLELLRGRGFDGSFEYCVTSDSCDDLSQ